MKKIISLMTASILISAVTAMSANAEDTLTYSMREKASQSDFNLDGRVTTEDVQFLANYWISNIDNENIDENIEKAADINGDDIADLGDAVSLLVYVKENTLPGDINEDGQINSGDASYLLKYIADSSESISGNNIAGLRCRAFGDINGDGKLTAIDASLILAYTAELASDENLTLEAFLASRNS